MNMRELNIEPIRSVERAIQILNCFSFEEPVLSIDEIMKKTKLAKATTYRLLWTLEKNNLIQYNRKTNEYSLGLKPLEYGGIVLENLDIRKEAEPYLLDLFEQTGHSVILAIPEGETLQYLLRFDSNEGLQPNNYVGRRRVLHNGALGIVLLAYMERDFVKSLIKAYPIEALTPKTLTDETLFLKRLDDIQTNQYFIDVDETFVGYTAIAVPILRGGKAVAAIGLSGASYKMEGSRREELIKQITEVANIITKKIGYIMA